MRPFAIRFTTFVAAITLLSVSALGLPHTAAACAGLIGSNGAVNLGRTTTLATYHNGVEHYVTAFQFLGGGGQFGTLIPLPDVPTSIERGGAWTLQRLVRETEPVRPLAARSAALAASADSAQVLLQTRVDALDLTVLKGGAAAVATWAREHGFRLSPDAPEVLDFYAQRSPIFLAAVFDGDAAARRGQRTGDGTPVHLTIPTSNPWVPLRILALGKQPGDRVEADVFLLTDRAPALLPGPRQGLTLAHSTPASPRLLADLRADAGMQWVPQSAWLTKLRVDSAAADVRYDLAVDVSGQNRPSRVAAGLELPAPTPALFRVLTAWPVWPMGSHRPAWVGPAAAFAAGAGLVVVIGVGLRAMRKGRSTPDG
ncbi:MAG: DUF2330 domain-containing protein [Chloroflexi bacterium]|nr:DUF2330 domain-containing protein [Chloroflexota bacterium]